VLCTLENQVNALYRIVTWLIALLIAASPTHASMLVYRDQQAFTDALANYAIDTFDDLGAGYTPVTLERTLQADDGYGTFNYTASAPGFFWGLEESSSEGGLWLSTQLATSQITLNQFDYGTNAVGGYFFATDYYGALEATDLYLMITDSLNNTFEYVMASATHQSFLGLISNNSMIESVTVGITQNPLASQNAALYRWVTIDDLQIGTGGTGPSEERPALPAPAPLALSLLWLGLGVITLIRGRGLVRRPEQKGTDGDRP
jgi:hypothetical protein